MKARTHAETFRNGRTGVWTWGPWSPCDARPTGTTFQAGYGRLPPNEPWPRRARTDYIDRAGHRMAVERVVSLKGNDGGTKNFEKSKA